jgi:hypothetical protein
VGRAARLPVEVEGADSTLVTAASPSDLLFLESKLTTEENDSEQRSQVEKWRQGCQVLILLLVTHWTLAGPSEELVFSANQPRSPVIIPFIQNSNLGKMSSVGDSG